MRKKILFVVLTWIILLLIPSIILYLLRENAYVREIIDWALNYWPILAALGGVAVFISGMIVRKDFSRKVEDNANKTLTIKEMQTVSRCR